ncbi:hypothetical protein TCELL_1198 [Thermogladius calderae 1633]|uniref:DUF499 domain-containing protein n=1 Tax=Thermogladius calderae (strain DSM 22663 / VKM B-2946 / 1633) TaxID=1184251 RepID=I3TFT3_THEC1|nr:hypothetical protein TCELL_1198 [Thermogladius calderae 1633]
MLKPRKEVLEGRIIEALSLADAYIANELRGRVEGVESLPESPLYEPKEFLKRTYFSESMKRVLLNVMGSLAGVQYLYKDKEGLDKFKVQNRILIIPSHLGGGKTHLLTTLYFVAKLVNEEGAHALRYLEVDDKTRNALKHAIDVLVQAGRKIQVVALVGDRKYLAPSPLNPVTVDGVKVNTPWGLLAHLLQEYDKVRVGDESFAAPFTDEIKKVLRDKTVLILIDEAVEYLEHATGVSRRVKDYDESYISFLKRLAEAVNDTPNSVLVVTLPAEYREGRLEPGPQHPEYVKKIFAELERVAPLKLPPMEKKEIVEVFKRRLFENAYESDAKRCAAEVAEEAFNKASADNALSDAIKIRYGDIAAFKRSLEGHYPFHPYFVETLVNIASTSPELGLTRHLISYVARLVKEVYDTASQRKREPRTALFTTWLIPLDAPEFRTDLLSKMPSDVQSDFQRIYEEDVKKKFGRKVEEYIWSLDPASPQEARDFVKAAVARTVWLTSIPGRGSKRSEVAKLYPVSKELPALVYDPLAFQRVFMADVVNAVDELLSESTYMVKTDENRVLYARIADLTKILREKYLSVTEHDALSVLEGLVNEQAIKGGRKIRRVRPITSHKFLELDLLRKEVEENDDPLVLMYIGLQEPDQNLVESLLSRNNVLFLLPDYNMDPMDWGLMYTETIKAIAGREPDTMRDFLLNLLKVVKAVRDLANNREYLLEVVGEEHLDDTRNKLKRLEEEVVRHVVLAIYTMMRRVVIGTRRQQYEVELRPTEGVSDLSNIVRLLEGALERRGVITKWEWSDVYNQLSGFKKLWDSNMSLKEPIKVKDLWDQLLNARDVEPHITGFSDLLDALKTAYENCMIAFRYKGEVLWIDYPFSEAEAEQFYRTGRKYACSWQKDVANKMERLGASVKELEAVHPSFVLNEYLERLRAKASTKPGERVVRRLAVYMPDGNKVDLTTFLETSKQNIVEALSSHPVVLVEETPPRVFNMRVTSVNGKQLGKEPVELGGEGGLEIVVEGSMESAEEFPVEIELKAVEEISRQTASSNRVEARSKGSFTAKITVNQPGEYIVVVTARDAAAPKGYRTEEVPVARVRVSGEYCVSRSVKGVDFANWEPPVGVRLELTKLNIEGRILKGAIKSLADLLNSLSTYRIYADGYVELENQGEELRISFRKASTNRLSRLLQSLGVDVDVYAKIELQSAGSNIRLADLIKLVEDRFKSLEAVLSLDYRECRSV